jgi:hypothetical protein
VRSDSDFGRWGVVAFAAVACLLAVAFYREFAFDTSRMLAGTDMLNEGYQLRNFGVEEIRSGRGFPLWNPYVYGGQPYLAILPGPVFYPTSLLYFFAPLFRAIGWTFVLHMALGGVFAWYAARSLGLGRWSASVSGLSFMFTGFVVSTVYGGHDGRMFAMALIPLAFAFLERGLRSGRVRWFLLLGLAVALQVFTPHIQLMYFSSLALSLYAAGRITQRWRAEGSWRTALKLVGLWALAFAVASLVGAAQLIPTYQIIGVAVRGSAGEAGYAFASSWALPPQEITSLFLPDLIGSLPGAYWGSNPFKLHTEYLGAVPLTLAGLAVVAEGRRDRRVWLLAGIAILSLLFALGAATPVHRVAYALVPFIKQFRAPSMMLGPTSLMVALLAGIGWQRVLHARERDGDLPWLWLWLGAAPFLLLGLTAALAPDGLMRWVRTTWYPMGWDRSVSVDLESALRVNGWLLVIGMGLTLGLARGVARGRLRAEVLLGLLALLVADLWRVDARYMSTMPIEDYSRSDPMIEHLQASLQPGQRVFPLPERGGYGQNELMIHRLPAVTGSQKFRLEWYERLVGGLSYRNLGAPAVWSLLDLEYITTRQEMNTGLLRAEAKGGRGTAYRVVGDASHAWFPVRVEATGDTAAALRQVLSQENWRELAVVEADLAPPAGSGTASVESTLPNELTLRVDAERAGLLVVSEVYYPAWRAFVDGRETEILRTNVALRGVVVPKGRHELRFVYSPSEFRTGFLLSGVALAGVLLCLVGTGIRARLGGRGQGR